MAHILDQRFFNRPAPDVAQDLLGKYLVRKVGGKTIALKITETEAYEGAEDLASHASRGRTKRTEAMFAEGGTIYIYLIYGMYHMLNIVTGKKDYPAAVLIRGAGDVSGPGRLAKFLNIGKALNAQVSTKKSGLWFEDRGETVPESQITKTARIGVDYAGPMWAKKEYRFLLKE